MATERTLVKYRVGARETTDEFFLEDPDEIYVEPETGILIVKNMSSDPKRHVTYNRHAWVKITSEAI
jgi:hypothetical protein